MTRLKSIMKCDRCQKQFETDSIAPQCMFSGLVDQLYILDLCEECKKEIYKYLMNWINRKEVYK